MAYSSSLLRSVADALAPSGVGGNNVWLYGLGRSTDTSTQVAAVGFFAGAGVGSKGSAPMGMKVGDLVIVQANSGTTLVTTGKVTLHTVLSATANVASTSLSSGFSAGYDVTISAGTTEHGGV